ncbi:MAG: enoyl-CoA hydratase/isomerase family protein [Acidobacteriota bacterium]
MSTFLSERIEDRVVTITLRCPEVLNSYDLEMLAQLQEAIVRLSEREDIRVVVLTGSGTAFCTGARLRFLLEALEADNVRSLKRLAETTRELFLLVRRLPQFTIASVNGLAVDGGLNLALSCDYAVAAEQAQFGYPFGQVGLSPDVGTAMLLAPLFTHVQALQFLLAGRLVGSAEARRLGLVQEIAPEKELIRRTLSMASWASRLPPVVVRGLKRNLQRASRQSSSLEGEVEARIRCLLSEDFREGVEAFLQNRRPRFRGQ